MRDQKTYYLVHELPPFMLAQPTRFATRLRLFGFPLPSETIGAALIEL